MVGWTSEKRRATALISKATGSERRKADKGAEPRDGCGKDALTAQLTRVDRRADRLRVDTVLDQLDQLVDTKVKDTRAQRRQEPGRLPAQVVDVVPDRVRALVLDKVLEDLDKVDAERADKLVLDGLGGGKDNKEGDEDELHAGAGRGALL